MKLTAFCKAWDGLCMYLPGKGLFRSKWWLTMKLTAFILMVASLHVTAGAYSQKVTISASALSLEKVLDQIQEQTGYSFFWSDQLIAQAPVVTVHLKDASLMQALDLCLKGLPFIYEIKEPEKFVYIRPGKVMLPVLTAPHMDTTRIVTGKVTDERGQPLPGASIRVKGTNNAVSSDGKGNFRLKNVREQAVLIVSFIGYKEKELTLTNKNDIMVALPQSSSELDQVQVIGFGNTTTSKRFNTGNVTTITAEEIRKNPVNNVFEAIQGKVPGLFIQQVTGQPGGAFRLRLRSAANLATGAPPPLVVVDGVMYPGATLPLSANTSYGTASFLQGGNGLNYLNPNDIESISVLKDADATALYGTSGAYGVILVTTKKAKLGTSPTFNANVYTGVSVLGKTPPIMNTEQYLMLRREGLKNDGRTPSAMDKDINGTWPEDRYNDYRKDLLGSYAQTTNASISYSGGSQNTSYLVGGSFRNNGNIQRHRGSHTDGSIRLSLNSTTNDNKFSIMLAATYLSSGNDMVPMDFSSSISLAAPNGPPLFLPDGNISWEEGTNDLAGDISKIYKNVTNNLLGNGSLVYRPFNGLTLHADISYNEISSREFMAYPTTAKPPTYANAAAETHSLSNVYNVRTISFSPYAEFSTRVFSKGDLNIRTGGRLDNKLSFSNEIHGEGFASDALLSNPSVGTRVTTSFNETPYRSVGAYAVLKFIWDEKYIVNLNGRRDGSTKFGPGRKFGNFGSVALSWLFSEEKFFQGLAPFISFGKLRGSTGLIGGDAVGDFAYLSTYSAASGTYLGKTGLSPNRLANPLLSWEKNRKSEIGLELGFFDDRIYAEVSAYRNISSNQLINQPLNSVTGMSSMAVNSDATIRTSGWEASLNSLNIKHRNFRWSTRFNISIPKSRLVKLPVNTTLNANYVLDKPVTGVVLYNYAGINPETGYYSFITLDGTKGDYTSGLKNEDKTVFLDLAPAYYGGFQNSFTYKRWSLDVSFAYTKRLGKNMLAQTGFPLGYMGLNGGTFWLDRWQQPGDVTDVPKISADFSNWSRHFYYQASSGAYSDASYARLQNLSLRYNVKAALLQRMRIKDLSVYLQGQNLLTISGYDGLDPENLDAGTIPPMRVFTAGINLTL
ncbi:SusC/RagA family TonB-linked outer membrane protein [Chitinophaga sp. XS-30]|uniref:SusC/RagA family TonB-linked outer membrane protein n=1 Tax=Chitinophaga sp. XS-30 TaxID=2604421 RepID=UPI0011DE545B|nr:SusC/RagA family TonB-linked outer membrane protein [Chitinophaga sp. XS-30]QEH40098.1 SusC/RagA family TonB-linked outer membrane protein [Chitinophaga sp. XS-30]